MKRLFTILGILVLSLSVFAGDIDFRVNLIYTKTKDDNLKKKLSDYKDKLQLLLANYNWEFPIENFSGISTYINVNIEDESEDYKFTGYISISSGVTEESRTRIPVTKDIFLQEKDALFTINYDTDPSLGSEDLQSLESIIKFYIYYSFMKNFDKLSYTDSRNFRLFGDFYVDKIKKYESDVLNAQLSEEWDDRIKLIQDLRLEKTDYLRRLFAYYYNAVYFFNEGKSDRAKLFKPFIMEILEGDMLSEEDVKDFMKTYYFGVGEIMHIDNDKDSIKKLMKIDPDHRNFFKQKYYIKD